MPKYKQYQSIRLNPSVVKNIKMATIAFAGLAGLTSLLICPAKAADTAEVKIDVNVGTVLSLAVYPHGDHATEVDHLSLGEAIPGGNIVYNSLDLVVRTNVESGYQLNMRDMDDNTSMQNVDGEGEIVTLTESVKPADFPDNHWGFAIGEYSSDIDFLGVPAASSAPVELSASETLTPGDGETTTVTFATKVNSGIGQGRYEDTVIFTVSPELIGTDPIPDSDAFFRIENMQDMTQEICQAATTPNITSKIFDTDGTHVGDANYIPKTTLFDARDDKAYEVQKLADGSCWMAQDLVFDSAGRRLTPANSDVTENITMPSGEDSGTRVTYPANNETSMIYTRSTATALSDGAMSICPKGWKLPIGGTNSVAGSYSKLLSTYNFTGGSSATSGFDQLRSSPFNYKATFGSQTKHPGGWTIFLNNYSIGWTTSSETVFAIGDDYSSGTITNPLPNGPTTISSHNYIVSANLGKTLYSKYQGYSPEVVLPDYAAVRCVAK